MSDEPLIINVSKTTGGELRHVPCLGIVHIFLSYGVRHQSGTGNWLRRVTLRCETCLSNFDVDPAVLHFPLTFDADAFEQWKRACTRPATADELACVNWRRMGGMVGA